MKRVLFAASEGLPYIKSGGLADVVGSLPPSLISPEIKVYVVLPLYKEIKNNFELKKLCKYYVKFGEEEILTIVYYQKYNEVDFYFIDSPQYFERNRLYGYQDDDLRFGFYCKAICDLISYLQIEIDIIHSNDWHTGLIPLICKESNNDKLKEIKHIFTIHNLAYQGIISFDINKYLNVIDNINSFMEAAIKYADKITTVSDNYKEEVLTEEFGEGLDNLLSIRKEDFYGILNGIDVDFFNPKCDKLIDNHFSKEDISNKRLIKKQIQEFFNLRIDDNVMLVAMIARMTSQKGINLVMESIYKIMGLDIQLIIVGSGEKKIEEQLRYLEVDFPHRAAYFNGYDEKISHLVYAGSDLFLMPSRFEPCGISQLIAMRYGTLPLVREVGGLKETITPYNKYDKTGNGFSFRNYCSEDLVHVLKMATSVFYDQKEDWFILQKAAMEYDSSWNKSIVKYKRLYQLLG